MDYQKVKSAPKVITVKGKKLSHLVLTTMKTIADIVGSTLGPGGQPVLIERSEHDLVPIVTKDGVTVFNALGFTDPSQHCVCESYRDSARRTATQAGDGPQPLWSKVLTPTGFIPMSDVKVGMDICGTDGTIQKIEGIFPKGKKEIIKVTFEQGQVVECCEDHLWSCVTNEGRSETVTTKQMMQDYKDPGAGGYFIPTTAVEFKPTEQLVFDPYLLGVYLKNSNSYTKNIPKEYLTSSRQDRTALLQGLVDTDEEGRFEFATNSEQLASDFKLLCRSLGGNPDSHLRSSIIGDEVCPERPTYSFSEAKEGSRGVKVVDIKKTGEFTEMQCIKVSNSNSLYITDDFIPTHNTTTTTIIGESIVRLSSQYCEANPKVSPQKVVRKLESTFDSIISPMIKDLSIKVNSTDVEGQTNLLSVATIAANGDTELAKAVLECYKLVGDQGSVTITEGAAGLKLYDVERSMGYSIGVGYDEACGRFYGKFINQHSTQKCVLEKPVFIVYHGQVNVPADLMNIIANITDCPTNNIVLVCTGISEAVVGWLGMVFEDPNTLNIFPLAINRPVSAMFNSQLHLLQDICAITGATMLDPLNRPFSSATLADLGPGVERFEASRGLSNIIGSAQGEEYEDELAEHVADVQIMSENPESIYDGTILKERIGKLTGGIAKLKVCSTSGGDIREKKDRAEDAVCAVRGAMQNGCLPGGGWTLLKLIEALKGSDDEVVTQVLVPSLYAPVNRLLSNCGFNEEEIDEIVTEVRSTLDEGYRVYDAYNREYVDALDGGVLDSASAVLEAIRSSLSISGNLGTLGGIVAYGRDIELERSEAVANIDFNNAVNRGDYNPANERP